MERYATIQRLTEALVLFRTRIGRSIMDVVRDGVEAGEFVPATDPQLTLCAPSTPARLRRRGGSRQPEALANVLDTHDSATQVKSTP